MKFSSMPGACVHAWEPHLWERARAYCPRCGSFARHDDVKHLYARAALDASGKGGGIQPIILDYVIDRVIVAPRGIDATTS